MAQASLAALRKKAKDMGIPATVIRSAEDADELQEIIDDHMPKKKAAVKKTTAKKTTAKKRGRPKGSKNKPKDEDDDAPKKRGRPKGSKNSTKVSGNKSKPVATKSGSGKTKRSTAGTRKSTTKTRTTARSNSSRNGYEAKGGRNMLEDVDFSETDGWNARPDSAPDRIIRALRKYRGNRDKAFDFLAKNIWDFVNRKTQSGERRSKAEAEKVLRYRISRTAWDFAMRTGQHEKSDNRVEYGTGGTGEGTFKRAKSNSRKNSTKPASRTTKTKTRTTKTTKTRTPAKTRTTAKRTTAKATTGKKRGRPVGSKNKRR